MGALFPGGPFKGSVPPELPSRASVQNAFAEQSQEQILVSLKSHVRVARELLGPRGVDRTIAGVLETVEAGLEELGTYLQVVVDQQNAGAFGFSPDDSATPYRTPTHNRRFVADSFDKLRRSRKSRSIAQSTLVGKIDFPPRTVQRAAPGSTWDRNQRAPWDRTTKIGTIDDAGGVQISGPQQVGPGGSANSTPVSTMQPQSGGTTEAFAASHADAHSAAGGDQYQPRETQEDRGHMQELTQLRRELESSIKRHDFLREPRIPYRMPEDRLPADAPIRHGPLNDCIVKHADPILNLKKTQEELESMLQTFEMTDTETHLDVE